MNIPIFFHPVYTKMCAVLDSYACMFLQKCNHTKDSVVYYIVSVFYLTTYLINLPMLVKVDKSHFVKQYHFMTTL